jgi:hypothetical protein
MHDLDASSECKSAFGVCPHEDDVIISTTVHKLKLHVLRAMLYYS